MPYMTIPQLTLLVIIILAFLSPIFVCVWFMGYSRGLKFIGALPDEDPTPPGHEHIEDPIDPVAIELVGYLDLSTGPISLEPAPKTMPVAIVPHIPDLNEEEVNELWDARIEMDRMHFKVDKAMAQVVAKDRMRARYLRLLKAERALIRSLLAGESPKLPAYWRRYQLNQQIMRDHAKILDELSLSHSGIANAPMLDRFIDRRAEALISLPENAGR